MTQKVSFQVPREIYIRAYYRRLILRPRTLGLLCLEIALAICCFVLGGGAEIAAYILVAFAIGTPIGFYIAVVKSIDNNPQLTDQKTFEFSSSGLIATGTNWKEERPWTRFRGLSEDGGYFYLHFTDVVVSIIPKSVFTSEQQQLFRQYAQTRNA